MFLYHIKLQNFTQFEHSYYAYLFLSNFTQNSQMSCNTTNVWRCSSDGAIDNSDSIGILLSL
jgi:hypothetical protein